MSGKANGKRQTLATEAKKIAAALSKSFCILSKTREILDLKAKFKTGTKRA